MESKTFSGRIAVGDDSPLEVALRVTSDQLQVAAGAVDIGTWPIADCTIRANGGGDFAVHVDGDAIHFTPDDHGDFAEMVASIDRGTLSGFLSGRTGLEGSEVAPKPAARKPRAAKPKQTRARSAEVDVAESGLADSEAAPPPSEVTLEGSQVEEVAESGLADSEAASPPSEVTLEDTQVEEVAERAPKHKKPRPAPKGTPRAPKRVLVDDIGQIDGVEADPASSSATSIEIAAGPEPAAEPFVADSIAPEHADNDRLDGVGGSWEIDPGPEPEPWSPQPEAPVVEVPVADETDPDSDAGWVADDPGPHQTVLDPVDETMPVPADEDVLDLGGEPGLVEPAGALADGSGVSPEDDLAQTEKAVDSPESLTERVMAIGGEGEELRRNFGQRLGRRRIAPVPPAAERVEDDGAAPEVTLEAPSPDEEIGTDAGSLAAAVEALRRQSDNEEEAVTVADAIIASQRSLRESSTKPSRLPGFLRRVAILTGVVLLLGGLGLGGYLAFRLLTQDAEPTGTTSAQPTPTVDGSQVTPSTSPVATTAPPTTEAVPETTVAPFQPTAFALTAPEFVKRWNETAASVNPQLALPSLLPGEFEFQLTPYVAVAGTVGAAGSVDTVTMTIDPTGPSEADAVGLQAMGMMIAVADPNLDGPGRRDLLASMGLDVSKPVLIGLDSATARGGVGYRLFYDDVAQRLFFTAAAG